MNLHKMKTDVKVFTGETWVIISLREMAFYRPREHLLGDLYGTFEGTLVSLHQDISGTSRKVMLTEHVTRPLLHPSPSLRLQSAATSHYRNIYIRKPETLIFLQLQYNFPLTSLLPIYFTINWRALKGS